MNIIRVLKIAGMIIGVYIFMKYILPITSPFLIGWIIALLVYPIAKRICENKYVKKMRIAKKTAAFGMVLFLVALIGLFVWLLIKECITSMPQWFTYYPNIEDNLRTFIQSCCCMLEDVTGIVAADSTQYIYAQMDRLKLMLVNDFRPEVLLQNTTASLKNIVLAVSVVIISVVSSILFIKDYEVFRDSLVRYEFCNKLWRVLKEMIQGCINYLKAQLKIMMIIAVICAVGLFMLGSRHFIWLGVGLGIADALPILGTGTILVPWAIVLLLQGKQQLALGYLLLFLVTSITRQLLEPQMVGETLGIYPIFVLAAVYFGVFIYGGVGVVLGPLSALLISGIWKEWKI